jgi:transcriptional regulator with XRE-family HTH domain
MSQEQEGARHSSEELSLIGGRLKALRKTNNLSQREVADAIGLPQSNLSRIENGKQRLNLTLLTRMLSIYELTIQDFFAREEKAAAAAADAISARERQLVESYRRLGSQDQDEIDDFVDYRLYRARRDRMRREDSPREDF